MSKTYDWLPGNRTDQLSMGNKWLRILKSLLAAKSNAPDGSTPQTRTTAAAWKIPDEIVLELQALVDAAETALTNAKNEETRTPVATAQCRTAFGAMIAAMRDMKKRYFYVPPLQESDLVALGLKIPDSTPSASGNPTAQVTIETYLIGRHQLGVKINYLTGSPSDAANKGYRIWYSVIAQGTPPLTNPGELNESFYTKRKKDVIEFAFEDSGKTACLDVQIENEGKKGPWGPMVQALIP
jgi:hypothetical protein